MPFFQLAPRAGHKMNCLHAKLKYLDKAQFLHFRLLELFAFGPAPCKMGSKRS
jgi:hypothetical protein